MADDIDKIKNFLRDNGANPESLFCAMQEAIIQQIKSILNLDNSLEQVSNCPSPQLQLGNDALYEIYIFVHQKLTNPNETLIDEVKDLDFAEVMFENARNNNNNNSGYGANNELENNSSSVTAITGNNNNNSVYGWNGNNNSVNANSARSFNTAKGGKRRTVKRNRKGRARKSRRS